MVPMTIWAALITLVALAPLASAAGIDESTSLSTDSLIPCAQSPSDGVCLAKDFCVAKSVGGTSTGSEDVIVRGCDEFGESISSSKRFKLEEQTDFRTLYLLAQANCQRQARRLPKEFILCQKTVDTNTCICRGKDRCNALINLSSASGYEDVRCVHPEADGDGNEVVGGFGKAANTEPTPESTESTPEPTEFTAGSTSESTESTTESTESTPESTESTAESTESTTESTESTPESTESTAESTESTTESTESTPESTESTPESTDSTPESTESTPDYPAIQIIDFGSSEDVTTGTVDVDGEAEDSGDGQTQSEEVTTDQASSEGSADSHTNQIVPQIQESVIIIEEVVDVKVQVPNTDSDESEETSDQSKPSNEDLSDPQEISEPLQGPELDMSNSKNMKWFEQLIENATQVIHQGVNQASTSFDIEKAVKDPAVLANQVQTVSMYPWLYVGLAVAAAFLVTGTILLTLLCLRGRVGKKEVENRAHSTYLIPPMLAKEPEKVSMA